MMDHFLGQRPESAALLALDSTYIFDSIIESYPNSTWGFMYYKIFFGGGCSLLQTAAAGAYF